MVDPYTASWNDEYQYRRMFPMTHEQFENEPVEVVRWMLEIDKIHGEARQKRREQPPEGGLM